MHRFLASAPALLGAVALVLLSPGAARADEDVDPWRGMNQSIHAFNDTLDVWVVEPVAKGYDFVVPEIVQQGVGNFFENLLVPRTVINDILQGDVGPAFRHTGRFMVNTVVGVGGLIDVAGYANMEHDPEDFGQTLGRWGAGTGPYLVLPVLGPSTVRDTLALPLDYAADPSFWVNEPAVTSSMTVLRLTNARADALEEIAESKADAIDWYVFVRDAYLQNREKNVNEGATEPDDDFYDTEDY